MKTRNRNWIILYERDGKPMNSYAQSPDMADAVSRFQENMECQVVACVESNLYERLKEGIDG